MVCDYACRRLLSAPAHTDAGSARMLSASDRDALPVCLSHGAVHTYLFVRDMYEIVGFIVHWESVDGVDCVCVYFSQCIIYSILLLIQVVNESN